MATLKVKVTLDLSESRGQSFYIGALKCSPQSGESSPSFPSLLPSFAPGFLP